MIRNVKMVNGKMLKWQKNIKMIKMVKQQNGKMVKILKQ